MKKNCTWNSLSFMQARESTRELRSHHKTGWDVFWQSHFYEIPPPPSHHHHHHHHHIPTGISRNNVITSKRLCNVAWITFLFITWHVLWDTMQPNIMRSWDASVSSLTVPLSWESSAHRLIPLKTLSNADFEVFFHVNMEKRLKKPWNRHLFHIPQCSWSLHCHEWTTMTIGGGVAAIQQYHWFLLELHIRSPTYMKIMFTWLY